jgi:hypothetical protein
MIKWNKKIQTRNETNFIIMPPSTNKKYWNSDKFLICINTLCNEEENNTIFYELFEIKEYIIKYLNKKIYKKLKPCQTQTSRHLPQPQDLNKENRIKRKIRKIFSNTNILKIYQIVENIFRDWKEYKFSVRDYGATQLIKKKILTYIRNISEDILNNIDFVNLFLYKNDLHLKEHKYIHTYFIFIKIISLAR